MRFLSSLFVAAQAWALAALAQDTSGEFYLRTQLKPGQAGKEGFDNLYLYAYHTGAGFNDAMLSSNKSHAVPGFLTASNVTAADGTPLYGLQFYLGTTTAYSLEPDISANLYAAWEPVRINIGGAPSNYSAFDIDADAGLEWTDAAGSTAPNSFNGWLGK